MNALESFDFEVTKQETQIAVFKNEKKNNNNEIKYGTNFSIVFF